MREALLNIAVDFVKKNISAVVQNMTEHGESQGSSLRHMVVSQKPFRIVPVVVTKKRAASPVNRRGAGQAGVRVTPNLSPVASSRSASTQPGSSQGGGNRNQSTVSSRQGSKADAPSKVKDEKKAGAKAKRKEIGKLRRQSFLHPTYSHS